MIIRHAPAPYSEEPFEIVERKGLGHPDTICDGISDSISRALSRYYLDHFGTILHHNVDKVLLIGGRSKPVLGGGEIIRPLSVVLGGRATDEFEGARIPVYEIATNATAEYLKKTVRHLNGHFAVEPRLSTGSTELRSLVKKVGANDTSMGVGFAPLSHMEQDVFEIERIARETRGSGDDVKVMGIRKGERAQFTIADAIVSKYAGSMNEYADIKANIAARAIEHISARWSDSSLAVNAADHGTNIYITVTGTSAEMGDDGETGRGNRANGLITPGRPMTLEAHAGKNPVNHVGKIYNIISIKAAEDIVKLGVEDAYVYLVSKIGAPLDEPQIKAVTIHGQADEKKIEYAVDYWLEQIPAFAEEFIAGKY
ncbi:methionine adenosyltransferase [Methanocella sp. MCL-LM]|uniref:methionine adenosyltransferase n=1 Tax=Methanocella sp. MCL-LM TaxID=3412035 RepID=UPI003C74D0FC